jgi:hypothetical protein
MATKVKSIRTGKIGYATEITSSKGSTWQVVTEGAENILHYPPQEYKRIFVPMGTAKSPIPDWMLPEEKKKAEQSSLF